MVTFGAWCQDQQIAERLVPLHIGAAFEVIVSRIDTARAAGSASGWPGLLMLFATGANLTTTHRRYVLRQICYFGASPTSSPTR